jgi:hypothetical protein
VPIKKCHDAFLGKLSDSEKYEFILGFRKLPNTENTLESGQVESND